jgi:hypothetical protein
MTRDGSFDLVLQTLVQVLGLVAGPWTEIPTTLSSVVTSLSLLSRYSHSSTHSLPTAVVYTIHQTFLLPKTLMQ